MFTLQELEAAASLVHSVVASGGNIERARYERVLNGVTPIVE